MGVGGTDLLLELDIIFGNWLGVVDECINIKINSGVNVRIKRTVLILGLTTVLNIRISNIPLT